jgi:SHS2 domain-containing protein
MPYKFFDHQADIGIVGVGKSYEQAFQEGAKAMFEVMCDVKTVKPTKSVSVDATAKDLSELFIEWLNELLAQKDIVDILFSSFKVIITKTKNGYKLAGVVKGETLDQKKHRLKVEVKAASYSQLKVWKDKNLYKAQCVVDV